MSSPRNIIVLRSSDGVPFEVEEAVTLLSETIRDGIENNWVEGGFPLPTIDSKILPLVIDFCKKHVHTSSSHLYLDEELMSWDTYFVKLEKDPFFDLIRAANYLNIKGLLELTCQSVADMIRGKNSAEIQEFFNISDIFTPEEKEEVTGVKRVGPRIYLMLLTTFNVKGLLDSTRHMVADMIKGITHVEIHKTFDAKSDFTLEEEEVKRENK